MTIAGKTDGNYAKPDKADLCPDAILWGGLPEEGPVPENIHFSVA